MNTLPIKIESNLYKDYSDSLKAQIDLLKEREEDSWRIALDMYMFSLRYIQTTYNLYKINPYQCYKDEIVDMSNKFIAHSMGKKKSWTTKLSDGLVEECSKIIAEMEKIPTK
jgi:GR25 family glycosyltransferase involved in LPS biosynthesis